MRNAAKVYSTYKNAVDGGDKNVYFLDATTVCDESDGHFGVTIEGSHLNDIGFKCLADAPGDIIAGIL